MLPLLVRIKLAPSGVPPKTLILPVAMLRPWLKLPVKPPVQAPEPSRFSIILRKAFCKPALAFSRASIRSLSALFSFVIRSLSLATSCVILSSSFLISFSSLSFKASIRPSRRLTSSSTFFSRSAIFLLTLAISASMYGLIILL